MSDLYYYSREFEYQNDYISAYPVFFNWYVVCKYNPNQYYGIVDSNNCIIIPIKYRVLSVVNSVIYADSGSSVELYDCNANLLVKSSDKLFIKLEGGIIKYSKDKKYWSLFNVEKGIETSPLLYREIIYFNDHLIMVSPRFQWEAGSYCRWGLITKSCHIVLPCEYYDIQDCGSFIIAYNHNSVKVIEINGHTIVPEGKYKSIRPISQNYYSYQRVDENSVKLGIMDKHLREVTPMVYDCLLEPERNTSASGNYFIFGLNKQQGVRYGLMNNRLEIILDAFFKILSFEKDGLFDDSDCIINYDGISYIENNVDTPNDRLIFPSDYYNISKISDALFVAKSKKKYDDFEHNEGIIDNSFKIVLPFEYSDISNISNVEVDTDTYTYYECFDSFYFNLCQRGKHYIFDAQRKEIYSSVYDFVGEIINNEYILVGTKKQEIFYWGLLSDKLKVILPTDFLMLHTIVDDLIVFLQDNCGGTYSLSNRCFNTISDCSYVDKISDGLIGFNRGGSLSERISEIYTNITVEKLLERPQNGKWGFIDKDCNIIIDCIFEDVGSFCSGFAPAKQSGKWGVINKSGVWIADPIYGCIEILHDGTATCFFDNEPIGEYEMIKNYKYFTSKTKGIRRPLIRHEQDWSDEDPWAFAKAELEDFKDNWDPN